MPDGSLPPNDQLSRQELLAEIERLRWLVEAQPQVPWEADAQGNITDFSQRWLDLTGLTREEALGGGWMRVPHPDDLPAMVEAWTRSIETGGPYDVEHRIQLAGGTYRWMRSRATARRGDSGEVVAWYATTEDIHERKEADAMLRATADAVPAYIAHFDAELRYRFCNRPFEKLFGRPLSEIVGRHIRDVVGDATFERIRPFLMRALSGETTRYDQWLEFEGGSRFMRGTYVPTRDAGGRVIGLSALVADETEARLSEEALRDAKARTDAILASADVATWVLDLQNDRLYADRNLARFFDVDTAIAQGGPTSAYVERLHPEDRPHVRAALGRSSAEGVPYDVEYRILTEGKERWVAARGIPERGEDGRVARLLGVVVDVTALKRAEGTLRKTGETFESLVQNSPFGIYVVDADFRLALVSQGAQKVFENVRPLLGRDFAEVLRTIWEEPFASEAIRLFRHTLDTGEPYHAPSTIETRHDLRAVEAYDWKIERIAMPDGRHAAVCHFYDLSERLGQEAALREAAEALRASESRLRLALETALLGTWDHDVQTGITHYSEAVGPMFGRARAPLSLPPEELLTYVHPDDRASVAERIRASLERGEPYLARFRVVGDDGVVRWAESRGDLKRDAEGRPLRVLGVALDVTEQVEAEWTLRQANEGLERAVAARTEELTRANRDLDEFAYSVAHDLRAPLRTIVSSSKILLEDAGERLTEDERETLERQATSGLRLAKIVDDLLGFARLANAELRKEDVHLSALARRVAGEVAARWDRPAQVDVQEGMRADGDPNLLGYALTNLLDNAIKFSPERGVVTVGEESEAFYVRDQGVGFDMAYAHKLFVAFERLVGQETFQGTGVGLANVKRIVERHGGRVWAESEPGKGATFWFTLR